MMMAGPDKTGSIFLGRVKRVHMIGVGGIGMSSLAALLLAQGLDVSGCDRSESSTLDRLRSMGARCTVGHDPGHLQDVDVVVVTSAVSMDIPEVSAAIKMDLPVISRGRLLAELSRHKELVAVAGAHGKTTTTAMISRIASEHGIDPIVALGGWDLQLRGNARYGNGDVFIAEADESDGSFLMLDPAVAVVTSLDPEHLDHWKTPDNYRKAFLDFLERLPFYGSAILCTDDDHLAGMAERLKKKPGRKIITYGLKEKRSDFWAEDIRIDDKGTSFVPVIHGTALRAVNLACPGVHHASNALAALAAASSMGISPESAAEELDGFKGVKRRFEIVGNAGGVLVIDDYAHHPTEVKVTLSAARSAYPGRRIIAVFQPHLFSRTRDHYKEFASALSPADRIFLSRIFAAREQPLEGVESGLIASVLKGLGNIVTQVEVLDNLASILFEEVEAGDVVLVMGAGDVWKVAYELVKKLGGKNQEGHG
ncbi:MAG: UDP-N-acetylmuramate--L-alanine ligase [Deltaproteobacteria bacterium]|nr:UDP-N-acetylmuramate--L-alanine ligase [Deltaproteobacteria bacterium]